MSDVIQKLKKKYEEDIDEISELRSDALLMRTDFNAKTLVILLKKFIDTADELMIAKQEDDRMDKMHESLKEILSGISDAFKNIKTPDIKPQINFDTKAITQLADEIRNQNKNIIELLKQKSNGNDESVNRELMVMIGRNNDFIGRAVQQYDYSTQLTNIANALNKKESEEKEIKEILVRRMNGFIDKIIPVYK